MINSKFYEALEVVVYIAIYSGGKAVSSSEICKYKNVAPRYLENLLKLLSKYNIIKGTTGPKGGYILAREKRKITLLEIAEIFKNSNIRHENNILASLKNNVESHLDQLLVGITLEEICKQAEPLLLGQFKTKPDFNI